MSSFAHAGPDLNEVISELQTQLNKEKARVEELEGRADSLKARESQLRMEFRKAESRKTSKSAELAAKSGMVKKKEAMYLDQKAQRDKLISECCQLDSNTKHLKVENKNAVEQVINLMLDFVVTEKEICKLVLCGKESAQLMLSNMDAEINRLTSLVSSQNNGNEISLEALSALENDIMISDNQLKQLKNEVALMDNQISSQKNEFEQLMNHTASEEIVAIRQNIAAINRKLENKSTN